MKTFEGSNKDGKTTATAFRNTQSPADSQTKPQQVDNRPEVTLQKRIKVLIDQSTFTQKTKQLHALVHGRQDSPSSVAQMATALQTPPQSFLNTPQPIQSIWIRDKDGKIVWKDIKPTADMEYTNMEIPADIDHPEGKLYRYLDQENVIDMGEDEEYLPSEEESMALELADFDINPSNPLQIDTELELEGLDPKKYKVKTNRKESLADAKKRELQKKREALLEVLIEKEQLADKKGHDLDMSNLNFRTSAQNLEKIGGSAKSGQALLEQEQKNRRKIDAARDQDDAVNPTIGNYQEITHQKTFLEGMNKGILKESDKKLVREKLEEGDTAPEKQKLKRKREEDWETRGFQEYREGVTYKSGTNIESQPYHFDPGVVHEEPNLHLLQKDEDGAWQLSAYDPSIDPTVTYGKEKEGKIGVKDYRPKTYRPFGVVEFKVPDGRFYLRPETKKYKPTLPNGEVPEKSYEDTHQNLTHRKTKYRSMYYIIVHTSPKISSIPQQLDDLEEAREWMESQGMDVIEQGDYYAESKAKRWFNKYQNAEVGIPAIPDVDRTNFPHSGEGAVADMGMLTEGSFEQVHTYALPPPEISVSKDEIANHASFKKEKYKKDRVKPVGKHQHSEASKKKDRYAWEDYTTNKFETEEYEHWPDLGIDHSKIIIEGRLVDKDEEETAKPVKKVKAKQRKEYAPNDAQNDYLNSKQLETVEVTPDGFCILNSLAISWGIHMADLNNQIIDVLTAAQNGQAPLLVDLLLTWGASVEEILYCNTHLESTWGTDMADPLIEVACYVIDRGITVLEENGKPYPLHNGGPVIVHVSYPNPHYQATQEQ